MSQTPKKSQIENKLNDQSEKRSTGSKQNAAIQSNSKDDNDSQVNQGIENKPIPEQNESSEDEHKPDLKKKSEEAGTSSGTNKAGTPKKNQKQPLKKSLRNGKQYIDSKYSCFNTYCLRKSNLLTPIDIKSHAIDQGKELEDPDFHPFKAYEKSMIEFQRPFTKDQSIIEIYLCEDCLKFHKTNQYCYYCKQIYYLDIDVDNLAWIQCDKCERWLHQDEVNKYKPPELEKKDIENEQYYCPQCYYQGSTEGGATAQSKNQPTKGGKQKRNVGKGNKNLTASHDNKKQKNSGHGNSHSHLPNGANSNGNPNSMHTIDHSDLQPAHAPLTKTKKHSLDQCDEEDGHLETGHNSHIMNGGVPSNIYTTNRFKENNNLGELPSKNKRREKEKEKQQSKLEEILFNHGISLQLDEIKIQEDILYFEQIRKNSCQIEENLSKTQLDQDSTQLNQTIDIQSNRTQMEIEQDTRTKKNHSSTKY